MEQLAYNTIDQLDIYAAGAHGGVPFSQRPYDKASRAWLLWVSEGVKIKDANMASGDGNFLPMIGMSVSSFCRASTVVRSAITLPLGTNHVKCVVIVRAPSASGEPEEWHYGSPIRSALIRAGHSYLYSSCYADVIFNASAESIADVENSKWGLTSYGRLVCYRDSPYVSFVDTDHHQIRNVSDGWMCPSIEEFTITDPLRCLRPDRHHVLIQDELATATFQEPGLNSCRNEDEYDAQSDLVPDFPRSYDIFLVTRAAMTGSLLGKLNHFKIQYHIWSPKMIYIAECGYSVLVLCSPDEITKIRHERIKAVSTYSRWVRSRVAHSRSHYPWSLVKGYDGRSASFEGGEGKIWIPNMPLKSKPLTEDETQEARLIHQRLIPVTCRSYLSRRDPSYFPAPGVVPIFHFGLDVDWVAKMRTLAFSPWAEELLALRTTLGVGMLSSLLCHIELWQAKAHRLDSVSVRHDHSTVRDLHRSTFKYPIAGHLVGCVEGSLQLYLSYLWFLYLERSGFTPYRWDGKTMVLHSNVVTHSVEELVDAVEWILSPESEPFYMLSCDLYGRDPMAHLQIIRNRATYLLLYISLPHTPIAQRQSIKSHKCLIPPRDKSFQWIYDL